jgi:hypothetical protein
MLSFLPPAVLELPQDYRLYLPQSDETEGGREVVSRVVRALADLYDLSDDDVLSVIGALDSILAIQLRSRDYESGSLPFLRFEGVIEKLRKTLLHTAAFVLTDTPTVETVPEEAQTYLARCRFLQTAVGSFVARVQLPEREPLAEATLFDEAVPSTDVSATLVDAFAFVTGRVLTSDNSVFTDEAFEENAHAINIDVFRDIGELLEKSGADNVNFTLTSSSGEQTISSGRLTPEGFARLDTFVEFARQRLAADQQIDVIGRIVELRSRRPDRRRNHVGVAAILDDHEVFIAMTMGKQDYPYAVMAHNRNRLVRVKAAVRRLKTQLRVIKLEVFEELEESADATDTK